MPDNTPAPSGRYAGAGWGIVLFMAAGACFVGIDVNAKLAAQDYSVWQVSWARFSFAAVISFGLMRRPLIALRAPGKVLGSTRPGLQLARALCLIGTSVCFFFSLTDLPLANALAIAFVAPLIVTALGSATLGEEVGPRRWIAAWFGFAGVVIIVRPGFGEFHWASLWVVASAFFNAAYMILTRVVGRYDPPAVSTLLAALLGALILSCVAPFVWTPPSLSGWAVLIAAGVFGAVSHYLLAAGFSRAPASTLAPFSYVQLVSETIAGYLVFGDIPDAATLAGAAVIVGAGIYLFMYEARSRRLSA